jgi:DNA-binding response OmpR family regulator
MKTIFYVEDNEDFLNLVASTVPANYRCIPFENPEGALEKVFAGEHPDLVITDLKMPGKSGIEFIVQLRAYGYRNPIIIATGHIEREEMILALRLGICDILDKPFSLESFHAALDRSERETEMSQVFKAMTTKLSGAISCLEEAVAGIHSPDHPAAENTTKLVSIAQLFKEEFEALQEQEKRLRYKSPIDDVLDPGLALPSDRS